MSYYFLVVILINLLFITHFNKILTIIKVIDSPNQSHKTHKENIPAIGGILLFINLLILVTYSFLNKEIFFSNASVLNNTNELIYFFIVYTFFFLKGVFDDVKNINANIKFLLSILFIIFLIIFDDKILLKALVFKDLNLEINLSFMKTFFTIFCVWNFRHTKDKIWNMSWRTF